MEFGVLGPLCVISDGTDVRLTARRHRALVAVLLLRRGRSASVDSLIAALWGERPPASAASTVRLYVSQVRKLMPAGRVTSSRGGYALVVEPGELDLEIFERLTARGAKAAAAANHELAAALYAQALALWRGPALADLVDEPFALLEAGRLDELRLQALELWAAAILELGQSDEVLPELQRVVAEHPLREGVRRLLMLALYGADRQPEALAVYREGRRHLVDELGLEPSDDLRELERRIHQRDPTLLVLAPGRSPAGPSPVPLPPTETVGRDAQIEELQRRLLSSPESLVTLVGPSGIGKTRLALEAGRRLETSFANGVYLIELAGLTDPELVMPTIGRALGVRESSERTWPALLAEAVAPLHALIILDNFEHLLDAAREVADLLRHAADLKVLVTSTTVLRVSGEVVVPVPPLAPGDAHNLFLRQAAQAGVPTVTMKSDAAIGAICERLEGSPLAIELAAPWLRILAPDDMLARLGEPLALSGGSRDSAERHRSLRAAIDWTYDLLAPAEQDVMLALAPFAGSFDLEAFEAVVGSNGLAALAALVDASLVQAGGGRYRLLESVREYVADKARDDAQVWRRHVAYFTELAETAERNLSGPEQVIWLARLDQEHDNLRAALDRLDKEVDEPLGELRLAAALGRFWYLRGHIAEGMERLERALERNEGITDALSAKALRLRSALAVIQGDYAVARELAEGAIDQYRAISDREGIARTLSNLGAILHAQGDLERSASILDECIERCAILGDSRLLALAENNRGDVALSQGDLRSAGAHFGRSLAAMRQLGDTANIARAVYNLGAVALEQAELDTAGKCFAESLDLAREVGDAEDVVWCLIGVAALACGLGRLDDAIRLLAAIDAMLASIGAAMKPFEERLYLRAREAVAAGSVADGILLTEADAVELALAIVRG